MSLVMPDIQKNIMDMAQGKIPHAAAVVTALLQTMSNMLAGSPTDVEQKVRFVRIL